MAEVREERTMGRTAGRAEGEPDERRGLPIWVAAPFNVRRTFRR